MCPTHGELALEGRAEARRSRWRAELGFDDPDGGPSWGSTIPMRPELRLDDPDGGPSWGSAVPDMLYVWGVDGGGTQTRVAIVDETGQVLGWGSAGPSNYDDIGIERAQQNLEQAAAMARQQAGLDLAPLAAAFLGMAGVVSAHDHEVIHHIAQDARLAPRDRVGVDHDIRIALAGGLSGRPGIALIAGTGSSCYGRNASGESWRAGGWGPLISDEGSGYWLGVAAMKAAVAAHDGRGPTTLLRERVLQRLGIKGIDEIMHRLYARQMSRAEIAALGPLVIEAARAGDPVAQALIRTGVEGLADCVLAVAQRLGFAQGACELAPVGGMLQAGEVFLAPLREAVLERLPHCQISLPELPPVLGACLLALQILGVPTDDTVLQKLRRTAPHF